MSRRRIWTSDRDRRLISFYQVGGDLEEVAEALGVTVTAAEHRASVLRKILPPGTVPVLKQRRKRTRPVEAPPASLQLNVWTPPVIDMPSPKGAASRPCLRCRETFNSAHAGNRLCPRCRTVETTPYAVAL